MNIVFEDLFHQLIQAARRLYKTPGQHLTLGQVVELNRRLLEGYTILRMNLA